jgi:hypothetical protein
MKEVRIGPGMQALAVVGALAGIGALVAAQVPEIQRYMKMRAM